MNPVAKALIRTFISGHVELYRLTKGRLGSKHTILLTTTGRKSGKHYTTPVLALKDGADYVVMASFGGQPQNPAWYLNLKANPRVAVEDHGKVVSSLAETVNNQDEYQFLWNQMIAFYPAYEDYRKRTTRVMPIVRVKPSQG